MSGQPVDKCDRAGENGTRKINRAQIEEGFAKQSKDSGSNSGHSRELFAGLMLGQCDQSARRVDLVEP